MLDAAPRRVPVGLRLAIGAALAGLIVASFGLRTHFVHDRVIREDGVRFMAADCWYHVRAAENLVHHFPHWNTFDPFAIFPNGQSVPVAPLLPWLLAGISLIVGGGSPSVRTIELVCAYAPPMLGSLTVLPVYWLGRMLFNRSAGLLAAALLIISPGQFLARTLLGYTDHHALEVLLSVTFVAMCVYSLRSCPSHPLLVARTRREALTAFARYAAFPMLTGAILGLYLLTWLGGSLLVAVLTGWLLIQWWVDHARHKPTAPLLRLAYPVLIVALLLALSWHTRLTARAMHVLSLLGGVCVSVGLIAGESFIARRRCSRRWFPVIVLCGVLAIAGGVAIALPGAARNVSGQLAQVWSGRAASLIPEAQPLLSVDGELSLTRVWAQFTLIFFLALPGLILLAIRGLRDNDRPALLVSIWSVAMLALTLCQNRFAYYYAINAALLTGYFVTWSLGMLQARRPARSNRNLLWSGIIGVGIFLLLFYPNIGRAIQTTRDILIPPDDWVHTLHWMRDNTPEPFGDPAAYYARYQPPPANSAHAYAYPDTAYGVMSSWSYGYWILRIAHRMPNANPGQHGARDAAEFFTAQDDPTAGAILDRLGARYVIVDSSMPYMETAPGGRVVGRIRSLAHWAGIPWTRFVEEWRAPARDGGLQRFMVYYPDYYRSLLARLYIFRGKPIEPTEAFVLSFVEQHDERGVRYKLLTGAKRFADYRLAAAFLEAQPPGTARLAGTNPYESCVPIDTRVATLRLIHRSPTVKCTLQGEPVANVEVYEYVKDRE